MCLPLGQSYAMSAIDAKYRAIGLHYATDASNAMSDSRTQCAHSLHARSTMLIGRVARERIDYTVLRTWMGARTYLNMPSCSDCFNVKRSINYLFTINQLFQYQNACCKRCSGWEKKQSIWKTVVTLFHQNVLTCWGDFDYLYTFQPNWMKKVQIKQSRIHWQK